MVPGLIKGHELNVVLLVSLVELCDNIQKKEKEKEWIDMSKCSFFSPFIMVAVEDTLKEARNRKRKKYQYMVYLSKLFPGAIGSYLLQY